MRKTTEMWVIGTLVLTIPSMFMLGFCLGERKVAAVERNLYGMKEKEKVEREKAQIVSDLVGATPQFNFLENMPLEQALYWTTLVQMSAPMPDSVVTRKWGLRFIPVGLTITDTETGNICDIVVGTIDTNEMEDKPLPRRFIARPHMTCYLRVPTGQMYRFENINNMSSGKYRIDVQQDYRNFESDRHAATYAKMIKDLIQKSIVGKRH